MQTIYIKFLTQEDRVRGFYQMATRSRITSYPGEIYQVPLESLKMLEDQHIGYRRATDEELKAIPDSFVKKWSIDPSRFNNDHEIERRVSTLPEVDRGAFRSALHFLYMNIVALDRKRLLQAKSHLDDAEKVLIQWLQTRTNGSERKKYGVKALLAARAARYCCNRCGCDDVRALNLDHVSGRVPDSEFECLCGNCHTIKSRENDWTGNKRENEIEPEQDP